LSREIRNAKSIINISSHTLQFTTYDFSQGYDWNPTGGGSTVLFDPTKITTVTYQCVLHNFGSSGNLVAIQKKEARPLPSVSPPDAYYYAGTILMPDITGAPPYYLFNRQLGADACPPAPCNYVLIHMKMAPPFHKATPLEYSIEAALRAFS